MYIGALVFRNDKVTRCQYAYNLKVPNVKTAFGLRSFSFAVPLEWNKLPFEMKIIPHKFDYRKKQNYFICLILKAFFEFDLVIWSKSIG